MILQNKISKTRNEDYIVKRFAAFVFAIGALLVSPKVEAQYFEYFKDVPFWEVNTKIKAEQIPGSTYFSNTDYFLLDIKEDSLVTFTSNDYPYHGTSITLKEPITNEEIISLGPTTEDGDLQYTKHIIQLRKGIYGVFVSGRHEIAYESIYSVEPLQNDYDIEPNNTRAQANKIQVNKLYKQLSTANSLYQEDFYFFDITEPSIVRLLASTDQKSDNRVGMFIVPEIDTEQTKLVSLSRTVSNTDDWQETSYEVFSPGRYYFVVRDMASVYDKNYKFMIEQQAIEKPERFKNGLNFNSIPLNTKYSGFISSEDNYSFSISKPANIGIVLNEHENQTKDLYFNLYKGGGSLKNLDYLAHSDNLSFNPKYLNIQLAPGNYTVSVEDFNRQITDRLYYDIAVYELLFSDVTVKNVYIGEITALANSGIIRGYEDGTFQPKNNITRKQVFTMLSRDRQLPLQPIRNMIPFKDINNNSSSYELIKPFYEAGVIDGSNGNMNLSSALTRAQLAKILVNAYNLKMKDVPLSFKDTPNNEYVQILASNGITTGSNGYFMPNKPVSREHFSVFLHRLYNADK